MIIYGNLGTKPEKHFSSSRRPYYRMRIAENWGKDESSRRAIWFEVAASISPAQAAALEVGQGVAVDGRLDAEAYLSKKAIGNAPVPDTWEGVMEFLKSRNALCVGLKILSQDVRPHSVTEDGKALEPVKADPKARVKALLHEQAQITVRVGQLQEQLPSVLGTDKMGSVMKELTELNTRSQAIKTELEALG